MTCARVMRGISSMAKAATLASASAFTASVWPYGSMMATTRAPGLRPFSSPSAGRRTLRTTSASLAASSARPAIVAPAASNSPSGMPAFRPAPACTATSAPKALYFFTVSGVAATRVSFPSVSERTAIRIEGLWFKLAASGGGVRPIVSRKGPPCLA